MFRDAEKQIKSCLRGQQQQQQTSTKISVIPIYLYLCKIYLKMDQPKNALNCFDDGLHSGVVVDFVLGKARIYELLNDIETSRILFKQVLSIEASNVEAMACLGS